MMMCMGLQTFVFRRSCLTFAIFTLDAYGFGVMYVSLADVLLSLIFLILHWRLFIGISCLTYIKLHDDGDESDD